MKRKYVCTIAMIFDQPIIVTAESRAKARYWCVKQAHASGYRGISFKHVTNVKLAK